MAYSVRTHGGMMAVRVLRLMEYTYSDLETAHADMAHWFIQGTYQPNKGITVRSTTILNPTPIEEPLPVVEYLPKPGTGNTVTEAHY